ncbi:MULTISPECIES: non-ribosomal peptide synthetase [Streptomyces]|uniref:non-ribosomal peptide synthetase n=1 Tax=Streptomyces TaxID=1883 RepID=UPI0022491247|nr:amino acid adenylation domain-containing protein [Streptomyces sp. JHD 1]MCX2969311.1 amino acid adenylation domain-containing protein [Streptomyces sp. JHD 1]
MSERTTERRTPERAPGTGGADGAEHAPAPVPELFARQAARTPSAVAVESDGVRWTYARLEARVHRIAHLLQRHGAGPGSLVAVVLDRSADLVAAVFAVLRSGAGYVPIAPDDPAERVRHVLDSCGPAVVVTGRAVGPELTGAHRGSVLALGAPGVEAELAACPATAPTGPGHRPARADDVAYVIHTSGSTGRPKGVVVEHGALARYLAHVRAHYPAVSGRALLHSSVSFDMAVTTLLAPLLSGGTVVPVDLLALASGAPLPADFAPPAFLKVTPSHLPLLRTLPARLAPTRQLVVGGEALLGTALDAWRREHPEVAVVNEYGPTEAAVGCCVFQVAPGERVRPGAVPIGVPTESTRLHVLDERLRPVPPGAVGELHIGGGQLARGYLHDPALTARRFLPDPYGPPGARMYRTGDAVRRRKDGNLEYLGRRDDQVKVGGHRVEPGEVAAVVGRSPLVDHAAVVLRDTGAGGRQLVAYVVPAAPAADGAFPEEALRAHAARFLPEYMLPAAFVPLDRLPLTPNGKLDRDLLPDPRAVRAAPSAPARDAREARLCALFAQVLGVGEVGIDDDFRHLGGTSVAAARLVSLAAAEGVALDVPGVLHRRTVRRLLQP